MASGFPSPAVVTPPPGASTKWKVGTSVGDGNSTAVVPAPGAAIKWQDESGASIKPESNRVGTSVGSWDDNSTTVVPASGAAIKWQDESDNPTPQKEEPGPISRYFNQIGPVALAKALTTPPTDASGTPTGEPLSLKTMANNAWNMAKGMAEGSFPTEQKAYQSIKQGNYGDALRHIFVGTSGAAGPIFDQAIDLANGGDYAGAAGQLTNIPLMLLGSKVPEAGAKIPAVSSALKAGVKAAGPDIGVGTAKVAAGVAGGTVASGIEGAPPWAKYAVGAYPVAKGLAQIGSGIGKGVEAAYKDWNPPPPEPPPPPILTGWPSGVPKPSFKPPTPEPPTLTGWPSQVPKPSFKAITQPATVESAPAPPSILDQIAQGQGFKSFSGLSLKDQATVRNIADRLPPQITPESVSSPSPPTQVTPQSLVDPEHPYQEQTLPESQNPSKAGSATGTASIKGARTVWARAMARRLYDSGRGITPEAASQISSKDLDPLATEIGLTPASLRSPETIQRMLQELNTLWQRK